MITLTVISFNGAPYGAALSGRFDELGGSIGRADTNQLVLPDPDRSISRVHAQVVFRNGGYAIIDRGSNPIAVNGQTLSGGGERLLKDGDQVTIGGFVLRAQVQAAGATAASTSSSSDPFADLLGPAAGAKSSPPRSAPPARAPAAPTSAPVSGGIPEDWDPFAPLAPAPGKAASVLPLDPRNLGLDVGAAAPAPLIPGMGSAAPAAESLDALFGLKPGGGQGDPFGNSALGESAAKPNMAAHADPLRSLQSAPKASAQTLPDDFSDLHRPFSLPAAPAAPVPAAPAPKPAAASSAAGAGAVLSWDSQPSGHTVIKPSPRATLASDPLIADAAPIAAPIATSKAAAPAPAPRPPASAVGGSPDALLAALQQGLGVPDLKLDALTPELMKLLGQIVRESACGTVDLLVARAALKREVRAEVTMIVARENNPLKFSPNGDVALQHLLSPPVRGFMPAAPAMKDAYNDLRAHQFGLVAGMRAALDGVLNLFDPAELESRLTRLSVLKSLLPGSRKAAMWDMFVEHYSQICAEAEDDFHSLFGKAFLEAYDEHIAGLDKHGGKS